MIDMLKYLAVRCGCILMEIFIYRMFLIMITMLRCQIFSPAVVSMKSLFLIWNLMKPRMRKGSISLEMRLLNL